MSDNKKVVLATLPISGEQRIEINLGLTCYSMTIIDAFDLASEIANVLSRNNCTTVDIPKPDNAQAENAALRARLKESEKDADALAEELRLEQNPGYTCAALANHEARKLSPPDAREVGNMRDEFKRNARRVRGKDGE